MALLAPPTGYANALPLTVTAGTAVGGNPGPQTPLTGTDHVVRLLLTGAAAATVYARCHDQTAGTDLTIWWLSGGTWVQVDADVEVLTAGTVDLRWKLQAGIGASSSDSNYLLAYGNASPVAMRNWDHIYVLADDFNGTALDGTKWNILQTASVSLSGSVLTIGSGGDTTPGPGNNTGVQSAAQFGLGYALRARGAMPYATQTPANQYWHSSIRFNNGDQYQVGAALRMQAAIFACNYFVAGNYWAANFNDNGNSDPALVWLPQDTGVPYDNVDHTWEIARSPAGYAYGSIDGAETDALDNMENGAAGYVWLTPSAVDGTTGHNVAGAITQRWQWVKVMPFVPARPVVTAGIPVFYPPPASRWIFG